jgi:hypothetical protein
MIILLLLLILILILYNKFKNIEGFVNNLSMRTCYPEGSADVGKCFKQVSKGDVQGVYITSAKVGSKACPWDNGGDPDYWTVMKDMKNKKKMKVWGMINMNKGDAMPNWNKVKQCMSGKGDRNGLFDGLLIDAENLTQKQCDEMKDLSVLNMPTMSVVGSGTCQNYINPKGHGYIAMCYDTGEQVEPCLNCSDVKLKGASIDKFMYSTKQWPDKLCKNKSFDIFNPGV